MAAPQAEPDRSSSDHYGLVFLLLIGAFLLSALVTHERARVFPLLLDAMVLVVLLRPSQLPGPRAGTAGRVLVAGVLASVVVTLVVTNRFVHSVVSLWLAGTLAFTIAVMLWRILIHHRVVTLQTIFGALSVYLLIGFLFAALFSALSQLQHDPLFANGRPANSATIQYFAFITMTTTGYGDFVAAGEPARSLAVLDALSGQIFLITLVARLVSMFGSRRDE
ncbi:potassium channel family protein [Micromonospora cremea]|uniref:Ion channel n=1 Tax=Micromonospora cremea TaxID=709881 RepID=A0A1N5WCX9_9ACTN|nr:potassium channel family protein [Micromonospora cremea]SIM82347.1 Ion channel [Micromonospora cremea]